MVLRSRAWLRLLLASLVVYGVTFFTRDRLPARTEILPALYEEPLQEPSNEPDFVEVAGGTAYLLTPVARYAIRGLVVTYHDSDSWLDISHREWDDKLNVKDLSLIWGYNLREGEYEKVAFSHGDWTGYYQWRGNVRFSGAHFSNNHLLVAKEKSFYRAVMGCRTGDQVLLEGYLVNYRIRGRPFERKTSLIRDDTGDGACEIIYLTRFEVLDEGNRGWRLLHRAGGWAALVSGLFLLATPIFVRRPRPYVGRRSG
jgi:hypothetical protein